MLRLATSRLSPVLIYVLIIAAAVSVARARLQKAAVEASAAFHVTTEVTNATQPFFSLSTTRTFGTNENPRIWLDHRLLESLDFRVYRINDPERFFAQLSDPHQMGDDEKTQLASQFSRRPSLLERVRPMRTQRVNVSRFSIGRTNMTYATVARLSLHPRPLDP